MRRASVVIVFVLAVVASVFALSAAIEFSVPVWAQAPKPAPAPSAAVEKVAAMPAERSLTDMQKLQVQNVLLRLELVQREAQELIKSLQVPGYTLDIQAMKYTAVPKEDPKAETKSDSPVVKKD